MAATTATTSANPMPTATSTPPIILPATGVARVKSVLSGDTVILLGKSVASNQPQPEVMFTLASVNAPRYVFSNIYILACCFLKKV